MYFGYGTKVAEPVRVGHHRHGRRRQCLIGAINPDYIDVRAICDIRPYNIHRAFHGDWRKPDTLTARPGLMKVYGWNSERRSQETAFQVYADYEDLLKNPDIEAVIIALPLFLHAPVAIAAMQQGKHVLDRKADGTFSVADCKNMARVAQRNNCCWPPGHQRHYSVLYDNAMQPAPVGPVGRGAPHSCAMAPRQPAREGQLERAPARR